MDWRNAEIENGKYNIPERWLHIHYYEALNILFRMENSLRVFVYIVLKNEYLDEWQNAPIQLTAGSSNIKNAVKERIKKVKNFGYLGYEINSPLGSGPINTIP